MLITQKLLDAEYNYRKRYYRKSLDRLHAAFPRLFAEAMTKGWAFTGQTREDHDKDIKELERQATEYLKSKR